MNGSVLQKCGAMNNKERLRNSHRLERIKKLWALELDAGLEKGPETGFHLCYLLGFDPCIRVL